MEKIKYAEAILELEAIVKEIELSEIAVDELSEKVKRASELIRICDDILKKTDKEISEILNSMNSKEENPL